MLTKDELITFLEKRGELSRGVNKDVDFAHRMADLDLLEYINDPDITSAYEWIIRYYEGKP